MNAPPTPPRGDEEEQRKKRKIQEHGGNDFRFGRNLLGELILKPVRPIERKKDLQHTIYYDPATRSPRGSEYRDHPNRQLAAQEPKRTTTRERTPEPPSSEEVENVLNQLLYGGNPPPPPPEDDPWAD